MEVDDAPHPAASGQVPRLKQAGAHTFKGNPFIYRVIPLSLYKDLSKFACITSCNTLVTFTTLAGIIKILREEKSIHNHITCLEPYKPNDEGLSTGLITGGRDGLVKRWDTTGQAMAEDLTTPNSGEVISALASDSLGNVAAGTENEKDGPGDAAIYLWAADGPTTPTRSYTESHSDTITALTFLHSHSHNSILVSASTDGLIQAFFADEPQEEDAIQASINTKGPVNHIQRVGIPLLTDTRALEAATEESPAIDVPGFWSISHDEKLFVSSFNATESEAVEMEMETDAPERTQQSAQQIDIREALGVDYTIALRPSPDASAVAVFAGANKPETVTEPTLTVAKVTSDKSGSIHSVDKMWEFKGAHGDEVIRDVWMRPQLLNGIKKVSKEELAGMIAVTVGEDGTIRTWMRDDGSRTIAGQFVKLEPIDLDNMGQKYKRRPKVPPGGSKGDKRFKPY